ncbi:putative membrane protein YadS [Chryseobacterium lathyri]|uniref:Membrane protein YadS n=1 Tax=Chryseobacterium lathyri TaxID=395933 RepID=A0ABT9SPE7_9FLAO|nr:putative membrane protein YadS [Chryseobacterium lathyri]MDQ0067974.1 putative membrane protein YadS [Chryseobacterium lathyri]
MPMNRDVVHFTGFVVKYQRVVMIISVLLYFSKIAFLSTGREEIRY